MSTRFPRSDVPARHLRVAMIGLRGIPATHGGVERAVEGLSTRLVERGHEVTVYARRSYAHSRLSEYRGVRLRYLPDINTKHLEAASHTAISLADVLRRDDHDLVHVHATGPALFSFLPRLRSRPCVVTVQGFDWRREKWGALARAALRLGARAAVTFPQGTVVVSRSLQREFAERYQRSTVYIPNGVNVPGDEDRDLGHSRFGLRSGGFVLFLGRLVPEKGVHTLLDAFRRTRTDLPLVVAGGQSHTRGYVRELERLAADDPRIRLIGPVYGQDKAWLLEHSRLYVQPSTVEGLSIALLEAMARGGYPVVSDIPENTEVVMDGGGRALGRVFRAGDPADLARTLEDALADPAREDVGRAAREHVRRRYDWVHIARETERLYLSLLADTAPAAGSVNGQRPAAAAAEAPAPVGW
jgi:glycosyltransferase involved in cell wall biosynthesis